MATRRIRETTNNKYVQPLKLGTGRKILLTLSNDYNSILFTKEHRATNPRNLLPSIWAKFNTSDFDGIDVIISLEKNGEKVNFSNCLLRVYSISLDQLWTESLLTSVNLTPVDGLIITNIPQNILGVELDGEVTLLLEISVSRRGRTFKKKIYLNHLGVYESIVRLRQDVEFLDITKLDE